MDGRAKVGELGFLTAGGEMGALMRAHDWSDSPLGPLDTWPQSLRTTVGLMLGAEAQIVLFWGPELCALYNDAYASIIGDKRPRALGRPAVENWTGLWDGLEPLLQGVRETGKTFAAKNRPFSIERHGDRGETVYFDVSYSAVPDADGSVGGVLCIVSETTERVHALRDLRESEARLRFIGELDEALRASGDAPAAMRAAARLLARRLGATRCAYAAVDADSDRFIIHDDYTMPGSASSAGTYSLDLFGPRAAADMRAGRTLVICNVLSELAPGEGREMFEAIGIEAIVCCPLVKDGRLVAMMAVHQDRSRDWQHNEIALVETVVERCWAHVERVGAEARLRASETRYRTLFESIESGFCIVEVDIEAPGDRIDYRVIEANPAFHQQTGFPDAILGKWLREAAPALEEHWYEIYGRVARTGEPARFEQGSDMLGRWFDVYAFHVGEPEQGRVAIMFNDISARRKAEERLRELNETLERRVAEALAERRVLADVIDGTDIFVQVADRDYTWLAINDAAAAEFARIFGVRPPKAGDSMLEMLKDRPADREAVKAVWSRALAGEEFVEVDEFGDPALDRRYYEMRFRTLRDAGGRAIGAYQFVSDVTERLREQARLKEAEEALRQSQKMEAVGQLTGGIAHDFNNLLTGIVGSLDMLRTRVSQGRLETVDRYVTAATTSANRAAALTHRLLAFARRQPLDPRPVQANALVASLEDLFRRTVGETVALEVVLAGGLWPTLCDPNQLESALLNLVINARDAMPGGGKLTIETCNAHLDNAYIAAQRDVRPGQYVCICVTDTGTGMPQDVIERAFEPFFTTKPIGQGTGLGLSMVYGFARQSEGHAKIYSEVGQGTTIKLYLPRYRGETDAEIEAATLAEVPRAGSGETVLVVEDEPVVRSLIIEVLEDLGYRTLEAADGPEGLKILQSRRRIDLLITDVGLPGLNGRQLADAARERRRDLKVLFITGYAENATLAAGFLEPGMQMITKPFAVDALAQRIRSIIRDE